MNKAIEWDGIVEGAATPEPDPIKEQQLEFEQAVLAIKRRRGRTLFLACSQFAPSKDQGGVDANHTRGRNVYSHIKVNTRQAVAYLTDAYSVNTRGKCLVRIATSQHCMFIGGSC
jgi:hypothetical protein